MYAVVISPVSAACPAHLILLRWIVLLIFSEEYKLWGSSFCNLMTKNFEITRSLYVWDAKVKVWAFLFRFIRTNGRLNSYRLFCFFRLMAAFQLGRLHDIECKCNYRLWIVKAVVKRGRRNHVYGVNETMNIFNQDKMTELGTARGSSWESDTLTVDSRRSAMPVCDRKNCDRVL